jgi:hypothetical protein
MSNQEISQVEKGEQSVEEKESRRHRRPPSLVGPVILITIGVLVLLSNLDMLHVNLWELWRLWPVLLILGGLEILLGRRSALGSVIVLVLTLAVMAGIVLLLVAAPGALGPTASGGVDRITEPLGGIEQADLKVSFAAGQLGIGQLADSTSLVEGTLGLATKAKPVWSIDRSGDHATMTLGYKQEQSFTTFSGGDDWNLQLSPQAAFSLDVDVGAGGATLDLTGLDVRDLKIQAGAGQTTVILPATGDFSADLSGGVGALTIEIPPAMAARLRIDRGLSGLSLPARFSKQGEDYVTSDWTTNQNRVDVYLSMGVGLLTVREP